jgi:hypothetical protein
MSILFGGKREIDHGIANVAKRGRRGEGETGKFVGDCISPSPVLPLSPSRSISAFA